MVTNGSTWSTTKIKQYNSHSVLCLWRGTTNLVSNKISRTRIWNCAEWTASNKTSRWIWVNIEATERFVLLDNEDNRHSNQRKIGYLRNRTRNQSNDFPSHNDSNRSHMGYTQQGHMDLQQSRISRKTTQKTTTSNLHTWQTMSSSNWQAWRLQTNNRTKNRWNNGGFWGTTSHLTANTGKENIGWTTMDTRNMV